MKTAFDFISFALSHAKKKTLPKDALLPVPADFVGSDGEWEYLYGTTGIVITPALLSERFKNHYKNKMTEDEYNNYTKDFIGRIACDCQGLLDCFLGVDVNAQYNYANWCTDKGKIDSSKHYPIGECFFMYSDTNKKMSHVGYVCGFLPSGEELVVEERGIAYGCVITKRSKRAWTHVGKPTAKLDFSKPIDIWTGAPAAPVKFELATPSHSGDAYLYMQKALNAAKYVDYEGKKLSEDGVWGKRSQHAFLEMVKQYAPGVNISLLIEGKEAFRTEAKHGLG